jgi:RimJ/RimL family protein N-acetyltransferase
VAIVTSRYGDAVPTPLERVTLTGQHVQLEPLSAHHADALVAAANVDRGTYDYTDVPSTPEAMRHYIDKLLTDHAAGSVLPFAQRRLDTGELAGCTRYLDIKWWRDRADPDEVEIGGTWLAASAQRTPINTEAKHLLLSHAFERLGVWRVAICTDALNERSRTAILRIGATFEGVLRNHRLRYNTDPPAPRDTAVFSITDAEWPAVKSRLDGMLGRL